MSWKVQMSWKVESETGVPRGLWTYKIPYMEVIQTRAVPTMSACFQISRWCGRGVI